MRSFWTTVTGSEQQSRVWITGQNGNSSLVQLDVDSGLNYGDTASLCYADGPEYPYPYITDGINVAWILQELGSAQAQQMGAGFSIPAPPAAAISPNMYGQMQGAAAARPPITQQGGSPSNPSTPRYNPPNPGYAARPGTATPPPAPPIPQGGRTVGAPPAGPVGGGGNGWRMVNGRWQQN